MDENFLERERVLEEHLGEVQPEITNFLLLRKCGVDRLSFCDLVSGRRLHDVKTESRKQITKVFLLHDKGWRVSDRDKIPERCHFGKVGLEELAVELAQKRLKLLAHVLDGTAVKKHEVEYLGALADILVPLSEAPT